MCFGIVCCGIESLCALCCCSSACCGSLFCCGGGEPQKLNVAGGYTVAKWFYSVGFGFTAIATWVLRDYAGQWVTDHVSSFKYCQSSTGDASAQCGGQEVAMRVSFANFSFFALHFLLTLCMNSEEDPRVSIHAGFWFWKLLIWIGTLIGFFYVPESALYGYAQAARVGSGIFIVIQLILMVTFVFQMNELLTHQWEMWWAKTLLVLGSFVGFFGSLVVIGFSYAFYAASSTCHLNIFFITWTLIMGIVMIGVLAVKNKMPSAGLMSSVLIWLYTSYLLYSALNSEPDDSVCFQGVGTTSRWIQIVSFFIALATISYSTITAGIDSDGFFGGKAKAQGTTTADEPLPYRADFFHLIFATASMYMCMLFTSWAVSTDTQSYTLDKGWASTWVKMASKWLCELLYIWTVIAPALFPDRDFSMSAV